MGVKSQIDERRRRRIGKRITRRRIKMGLQQRDLAIQMGVNQSSVSTAETEGLSMLSAVYRWAKVLGVSPQWLAFGPRKRKVVNGV